MHPRNDKTFARAGRFCMDADAASRIEPDDCSDDINLPELAGKSTGRCGAHAGIIEIASVEGVASSKIAPVGLGKASGAPSDHPPASALRMANLQRPRLNAQRRVSRTCRGGLPLIFCRYGHGGEPCQFHQSIPPESGLLRGEPIPPRRTRVWGGDTGFNWSAGGALAASAYLEKHFGSVWVDGQLKRAVPIDGVKAEILSWDGPRSPSALSLC